jgi:two-component system, NtrC family, response regulator AtoC
MSSKPSVLVVDDDAAVSRVLAALLGQGGFEASLASSAEAALAALDAAPVDLVLSDVRMPGRSGLELLKLLKERQPELPVVLITAHGTVPLAVEAMREGAADFLLKPFQREEVLFVVQKALSASQRAREAPPPRTTSAATQALVGEAPALEEARQLILKAAASQATVLVLGETGTGKELAARAIHLASARAKGAFVHLDCGALPETLFESELFGYERGAFTGAMARKPGRVELAQGGTLFLDEVGELSLSSQVKLLRLLQEREFERLGGTETLKADVRVVAATHQVLAEMVQAGRFREDLRYRLEVIPITMPTLRSRPEDVPGLVRHFLTTLGASNGRPGVTVSPPALELLSRQRWPGNVRQLQNFVERLLVLSEGTTLGLAEVARELERTDGAAPPAAKAGGASLEARRQGAERDAVAEALRKARGNRSLAARLLGVSRRTLYNKLEALGLGDAER